VEATLIEVTHISYTINQWKQHWLK